MIEPQGEGWLTVAEVAKIWDVRVDSVRSFAKAKKLTLFVGTSVFNCPKHWYREEEVRAITQSQERQKRKRRRLECEARLERRREVGFSNEGDEMLTTREAAAIIGISMGTLSNYIRSHRLLGIQSKPGQEGSRYRVPRRVAETFRDDKRRVRRNAILMQSRGNYRTIGSGLEPEEPWLTTAQVKDCMRISSHTIMVLRRAGKIRFGKQIGHTETGHACWRYLYCKADIRNLLADPGYQERRRRYAKAEQGREARAVEWAIKVNSRNDPRRIITYQGGPGGIW